MKHISTQTNGDAFIVEFKVVETSDPVNHPVGSLRKFYRPMSNKIMAQKDIVKFVYAVYGYDPGRDGERADKELMPVIKARTNQACTPDEAGKKLFNGKPVRASVWRKAPTPEELAVNPTAKGWENVTFRPYDKNPPPAPGTSR